MKSNGTRLVWLLGSLALFNNGCSSDLEAPSSPGNAPAMMQGDARQTPDLPLGGAGNGPSAPPSNAGAGAPAMRGNATNAMAGMPGPAAGRMAAAGTAGVAAVGGMGAGAAGSTTSGASGAAADSGSVATLGTLPPVTTVDGPGPYKEIVKLKDIPPGGWLIYPKDIGKDGVKHPIFAWGPGAGTGPDTYDMKGHFDRWVSHGIVVYCPTMSTGDGTELKKGVDWVIMQNEAPDSPVYHKLDTTKIAAGGHSQGSITTFAFADDPRLTTTLHISGGSFDGMGPNKLKKPAAYICGGADTLAGPNCSRDFMNTKVPVYFSTIDGVDHVSAAREAWAPIVAWLRWQLAGETQWRKDFLEPTGAFQTGKFKAMTKNW